MIETPDNDKALSLHHPKTDVKVKGRIREISRREGFKMIDVAKAIDISQSQLTKINSGKSSVSIETIKKIADFLDVCFVELIELPKGFVYTMNREGKINGMIDTNNIDKKE